MSKLLFSLSLLPHLVFAQNTTERSIKVLGKATKEIDPDEIELTILFAETENVKRENELKKFTSAYGISSEDLVIDNFTASRSGYYYKSSSSKVRLTKAYKLRLVNISIADELILKLFEIGADNVSVTNLFSEKTEQIKSEAITEALTYAKDKAELMAKHMGAELGKVILMEEYAPQSGHPNLSYDNFKMSEHAAWGYGAVSRARGASGEGIGIRKISIQYLVHVTFELK